VALKADGACRTCNAPITWVITPTGGHMPLNPEPADDGNIWIATLTADGKMVIGVALHHDGVPEGQTAYVSHFVDCPQAQSWRKR
jgi:hypothetical protein